MAGRITSETMRRWRAADSIAAPRQAGEPPEPTVADIISIPPPPKRKRPSVSGYYHLTLLCVVSLHEPGGAPAGCHLSIETFDPDRRVAIAKAQRGGWEVKGREAFCPVCSKAARMAISRQAHGALGLG